eukprot:CAMPEP_0115246802 /NCGR_PEP_ID=MMETSP0270-20121206/41219_1 /TAXON_ID=71861 /ORGANISM="Scrippsiella trochoidea, Strain CCMP3099" /LENGTH=89 /DNA_ID=CAMNT_0002662037 /DNA_START=442 /DNA_END=710 /DNA_ORIENTATION=+
MQIQIHPLPPITHATALGVEEADVSSMLQYHTVVVILLQVLQGVAQGLRQEKGGAEVHLELPSGTRETWRAAAESSDAHALTQELLAKI